MATDPDKDKFTSLSSSLGLWLTMMVNLSVLVILCINVTSWKKDIEFAIAGGWTYKQQVAFVDVLRETNPEIKVPPISRFAVVHNKGD